MDSWRAPAERLDHGPHALFAQFLESVKNYDLRDAGLGRLIHMQLSHRNPPLHGCVGVVLLAYSWKKESH